AAVGVAAVDRDLGVVRGIAAAAGDRDRAIHHPGVRDAVVAAVAVGLLTAATADRVVADQAHARERRVGLQPDVVGARGRRGVGAALRVAALVRAAVVGAVGQLGGAMVMEGGVVDSAGPDGA